MLRWLPLGLFLLALLVAGCSNESERNQNRDAGRPKSEPVAPKK
jgi:hypothetical protein